MHFLPPPEQHLSVILFSDPVTRGISQTQCYYFYHSRACARPNACEQLPTRGRPVIMSYGESEPTAIARTEVVYTSPGLPLPDEHCDDGEAPTGDLHDIFAEYEKEFGPIPVLPKTRKEQKKGREDPPSSSVDCISHLGGKTNSAASEKNPLRGSVNDGDASGAGDSIVTGANREREVAKDRKTRPHNPHVSGSGSLAPQRPGLWHDLDNQQKPAFVFPPDIYVRLPDDFNPSTFKPSTSWTNASRQVPNSPLSSARLNDNPRSLVNGHIGEEIMNPTSRPILIDADNNEWEVNRLLGKWTREGISQYLVWWKGCSEKESTWEEEVSTELVRNYEANFRGKNNFAIKQLLRKRTRHGKTEYRVRWEYPVRWKGWALQETWEEEATICKVRIMEFQRKRGRTRRRRRQG